MLQMQKVGQAGLCSVGSNCFRGFGYSTVKTLNMELDMVQHKPHEAKNKSPGGGVSRISEAPEVLKR